MPSAKAFVGEAKTDEPTLIGNEEASKTNISCFLDIFTTGCKSRADIVKLSKTILSNELIHCAKEAYLVESKEGTYQLTLKGWRYLHKNPLESQALPDYAKQAEELKKSTSLDYKDIVLTQPVELDVKEHIADFSEQKDLEGILNVEKTECVFLANCSKGSKDLFILVPPNQKLMFGPAELCLEKASPNLERLEVCELNNLIKPIHKNAIYDLSEGMFRTKKCAVLSLEEFSKDFFYRIIPNIHPSILPSIVESWGLREPLERFFSDGGEFDTRLKFFFQAGLVNYGNSCRPDLMKYQPHLLVQTNTKVGKTYIHSKICGNHRLDKATPAGLLGFASSDKSSEGQINNLYRSVCIDDIAEGTSQNITDRLPTLLEQGEVNIVSGCRQIKTTCSSQFIFQTNTAGKDLNKTESAFELASLLSRLGDNPERQGSRFGAIVFGNSFQTFFMNKIPNPRRMRVEKVYILEVFKHISKEAERLIDSCETIQQFLELRDEKFSEKIITLAKTAGLDVKIKSVLLSFSDGGRHQKGLAFKIGLIEYFSDHPDELKKVVEGGEIVDIEGLMASCVTAWETFKNYQMNMLHDFIEGGREGTIYIDDFPEYLQSLVAAICKLVKEKKIKKGVVLEELNDYLDKEGYYAQISRIASKLKPSKANRYLARLDLTLQEKNGTFIIIFGEGVYELLEKLEKDAPRIIPPNKEVEF